MATRYFLDGSASERARGEILVLQLLDRGRVAAQVRAVKDGHVGLPFTGDGGVTP